LTERRAKSGLLALLTLWTVVPVVVLALHAHGRGRWYPWVFDSAYDQLQYFAWVRDLGDHLLASNLFRIGDSSHVFVDPLFFVAGLLARIGLSPPLAFWVIAPVTLCLLGFGPYAWARVRLGSPGAAVVAVVLGLFWFTPVYVVVDWVGADPGRLGAAAGAAFVGPLTWGGLPAATAIALVPVVMVLAERGRTRAAAVVALLTAWVHPWQGEQLALTFAGAVALDRRPLRARAPVAVVALAALPPIAYFALLGHYDQDWEIARRQAHSGEVQVWALALVLAPLALPALFGLGRVRDELGERLLALLPLACLVAFAITPTVRSHALGGIANPLAILAVRGWMRIGWSRALGVATACAVIAMSIVQQGRLLGQKADSRLQPYLIGENEHAALRYLDRAPESGGVLARLPFASLVPGYTGRQTFAGHESWTPDPVVRFTLADRLIAQPTNPATARRFVAATGARFVLADCDANPSLAKTLAPITASTHRFGCATVYTLRR
jgi:hypothetical protein